MFINSIKRTARKLVFWISSIWHGGCCWNIFYLENFARSAFVKFWDPQKSYFFQCFWRFFLKSTQNLKLQQCPSQDLKVSSLTVKPSQIPQNLAIPVQIPSDRFYRQIYSPRATWCDCANFYLKWLRATPKLATSIWRNRWISSILASWNIYFLSGIFPNRSQHHRFLALSQLQSPTSKGYSGLSFLVKQAGIQAPQWPTPTACLNSSLFILLVLRTFAPIHQTNSLVVQSRTGKHVVQVL